MILLACLALIFSGAATLLFTRAEPNVDTTFAAPTSGRVIVIDAGHGGMG